MEKKISCGILICTEHGFLAVHPTGRKEEFGCYDIPKGCQEPTDVSAYVTAVRELKEETGLDLEYIANFAEVELWDFGLNSYLKDKDLYLFVAEIPDIDKFFNFKCTSFFESESGVEIPEVNGYKWVRDLNYYFKSLNKVFNNLLNNNKQFKGVLHKYGHA